MRTVLIVDDADFVRESIGRIVEKMGYSVIGEAKNGEAAVKMYKKLKPDIVTMDITMPKMNGIEALKSIINFDPDAKVIMITAFGQNNMIKESIFNGAKFFLVKPFKEEYVIRMLKGVAESF